MKSDTLNFVLAFQAFLALFLLGSLYFCLKNKAASKIYWNFGKNIAAAFVLIELLIFVAQGAVAPASFIIPFHFISVALSIMGGMILACRLKQPSLPILTWLTRSRKRSLQKNLTSFLKPIVIYSIFICAFTFLLFKLTHPEISDFFQEETAQGQLSIKAKVELGSILFFILVAFYEETVFRLLIQTFFSYLLRKFSWGTPIAIVGASLLFAIGHFGILATWWVKFVQTLVLGMVLGHLMKRHGMETSFAVHSVLNIFALYSSNLLLTS